MSIIIQRRDRPEEPVDYQATAGSGSALTTARRTATIVMLVYAVLAALWLLVAYLVPAAPQPGTYVLQGLAFVAVTGGLLYSFTARILARATERERQAAERERQAAEQLDRQRRALERANRALLASYDTTLSGWSRALDLRDRETEGHSARVTALAVRLAQAMGISGEQLEHVRRGAMLHDIGKIGVPDAILHKPGPLADDEWAVMRKHPEFAYTLLAPIDFLRPVLDIPYCHHERWNGTGYPRGLAGEHIPLAARIFAVVDVWDALRSDRPYRRAWSHERTLRYLRMHAGTLFDPDVVRTFYDLIERERQAGFTSPAALPTRHWRRV